MIDDAKVTEYHLEEIIYAQPNKGESFCFYLYNAAGMHNGRQWFTSGKIRYPLEEVSVMEARRRIEAHIATGNEVRICDGSDYLIFHVRRGVILYPDVEAMATFWKRL